MNPSIYISKKLQRILDLFKDKASVYFSTLMVVSGYKSPYSAMASVLKLMEAGEIYVGFDKYKNEFKHIDK